MGCKTTKIHIDEGSKVIEEVNMIFLDTADDFVRHYVAWSTMKPVINVNINNVMIVNGSRNNALESSGGNSLSILGQNELKNMINQQVQNVHVFIDEDVSHKNFYFNCKESDFCLLRKICQ